MSTQLLSCSLIALIRKHLGSTKLRVALQAHGCWSCRWRTVWWPKGARQQRGVCAQTGLEASPGSLEWAIPYSRVHRSWSRREDTGSMGHIHLALQIFAPWARYKRRQSEWSPAPRAEAVLPWFKENNSTLISNLLNTYSLESPLGITEKSESSLSLFFFPSPFEMNTTVQW